MNVQAFYATLFACLFTLPPDSYGAVIENVEGGPWSSPGIWTGKKVPGPGDDVLIRAGTLVVYDVESDAALRSIRVAGTLKFARDRDTSLTVGVIRVQPGNNAEGTGAEDVHDHQAPADRHEARLEIGVPTDPIPRPHTARIRLKFMEGLDRDSAPGILVRPGGRFECHGAPLSRSWLDLARDTSKGATTVTVQGSTAGWQVGDEVVITGGRDRSSEQREKSETRIIRAIDGAQISLDQPLENPHAGNGKFRSEIANLRRNVVIESADPDGERGHTMYHRYSRGSISYARFHRLGKRGVLGRYPIHFHLVRDSMRGSSVVGVVITDSHNRWVTVHGAQYIVVRDCVGLRSVGHGFFLEDATEIYNVLDRNLAIQASDGKKLKDQALPFDLNDAAGFWWANCKNTFIRNVSCENETYGYRFDLQKRSHFDPVLPIRQPDGGVKKVDVRTLPLFRFEDNEAHTEGFYGMVLAANGNDQPDSPITNPGMLNRIRRIDWTGPDRQHPHIIRNLSIWGAHYALRPHSPNMRLENLFLWGANYGVYRPAFDHHEYVNLHLANLGSEPFNRGMDDASAQTGPITVDGLVVEDMRRNSPAHPVIHMTDNNLGDEEVACHFRNLEIRNCHPERQIFNRGGSVRRDPFVERGVPYYLHDHFGPGRTAKFISTKAPELKESGEVYRREPPLTGDESEVTEVQNVDFPKLLDPIDDEPPATMITRHWMEDGKLVVEGTTTDNVETRQVTVNGVAARDVDYNFHRWRVRLDAALVLTAFAVDAAGNRERTPHVLRIKGSGGH